MVGRWRGRRRWGGPAAIYSRRSTRASCRRWWRRRKQSFDDFEQLIEREGLACDYRRTGRFTGAHAPAAMRSLETRAELLNRARPGEARLVSRADMGGEIATTRYHGGLVVQRAGSLHPGKYVQELARVAEATGASLHGGVSVEGYTREGSGFRVPHLGR